MNNIEKKVKEKIKEYADDKYLDGYIKNEFLTDDGKADIFLKVNNNNELFDTKTYRTQLDLNKKVYDHIDEKSSMLNNNIELTLRIIGTDMTQKEKEKVRHIISEHYAIELYKKQKTYKRHRSKIIKLILIGIFFLICYALIVFKSSSKFFLEVFGFLFSFSLWQAFENLLNMLSQIKIDRKSITQRLLMKVVFEDISKK